MKFTSNKLVYFAILLALFACNKLDTNDGTNDENPKLFIAGYIPWYGIENFDYEALNHIDRLYYFSVAPDSAGDYIMDPKHKQNLKLLSIETAGMETELFLVLGGWYESETIFPMAKDAQKRTNYIDSLMQFCMANNLDGIDLDWEAYPTEVPEDQYLALVNELSLKLHQNNLEFTVAVAASHQELAAKFKDKADQINIMSYGVLDENGNQVPMPMLTEWLANLDAAGVPRAKLMVGVPFYGKRPYNANDNSPRAITYANIVKQSSPEYDENTYGAYSFNGRGLMQTKTKYVRKNGYFGIMAWELSQDVDYNSKYCLLKSIVEIAK